MQSLLTWRRWTGSKTRFTGGAVRMTANGVLVACLLASPVRSEQAPAADSPPPRVHPVEPGDPQNLSCSIQVENQPAGQQQAATLVPVGGADAARSRNIAGPITDPQQSGDSQLQRRLQQIASELEALARAADSDGQTQIAQAIRKSVDNLKACAPTVQPDPGTLIGYRGQVGQSFVFEVTGRTDGTVWGSGIYTDDSMLAAAAVHAGVLKPGEKGLVRVTIQPGLSAYTADTQNGVTTTPYGAWEGSYTISPAHLPERMPQVRESYAPTPK